MILKSLSEKVMLLSHVNRRSFFQRVAIGAGAAFLWNSCAWTESNRERDIKNAIKTIWEKEPSDPEDIKLLKDILLPWSGQPSADITIEASRALALHADFFVIPTYKEVFLKNFRNETFLKNFIPLLAFNYTVNPPGRLKIIYFLYNLSLKIEQRRGLNLSNSAIEQATSAFQFLGNIAIRNYLIKLNIAMTVPHQDKSVIAYQHDLQHLIGEVYPHFLNINFEDIRAERFPDEKKSNHGRLN